MADSARVQRLKELAESDGFADPLVQEIDLQVRSGIMYPPGSANNNKRKKKVLKANQPAASAKSDATKPSYQEQLKAGRATRKGPSLKSK
jgi:hypothetical protein